jgi:hypothetical protein
MNTDDITKEIQALEDLDLILARIDDERKTVDQLLQNLNATQAEIADEIKYQDKLFDAIIAITDLCAEIYGTTHCPYEGILDLLRDDLRSSEKSEQYLRGKVQAYRDDIELFGFTTIRECYGSGLWSIEC